MKKLLLILLCLPMIGFAQNVKPGINYQAVARDANGDVLMNKALTIRFSIISDLSTSALSWQETHSVTTNDYGLFEAIIGQGYPTLLFSSAFFEDVDWGASDYMYLKVEVDYGGGLIDMGTTSFRSVPYALYASNSGTSGPTYSIGDTAQGGIVFWVSADGRHGLVVATVDQALYSDWYGASEIVSRNTAHSPEGQQFKDWRLPKYWELNEIEQNLNISLLSLAVGPYWTSSEDDYQHSYVYYFFNNVGSTPLHKQSTATVRAVRAF